LYRKLAGDSAHLQTAGDWASRADCVRCVCFGTWQCRPIIIVVILSLRPSWQVVIPMSCVFRGESSVCLVGARLAAVRQSRPANFPSALAYFTTRAPILHFCDLFSGISAVPNYSPLSQAFGCNWPKTTSAAHSIGEWRQSFGTAAVKTIKTRNKQQAHLETVQKTGLVVLRRIYVKIWSQAV